MPCPDESIYSAYTALTMHPTQDSRSQQQRPQRKDGEMVAGAKVTLCPVMADSVGMDLPHFYYN